MDSAMLTILSIHWNLCMGTIASYAAGRPDLLPLLTKLQGFEICGEYMLTEVGHGLDARNIETYAMLQRDGSFLLHTPSASAAKIMPPTTLLAGMPRVAVVYARLIVDGECRNIRPFVVHLHSVDRMMPGVTCRLLPGRPGAKALDHAITRFDRVRLESWALLGDLHEPEDARIHLYRQFARVTVGTLALSMTNIPTLRVSSYIAGRYSQRRHVSGNKQDEKVPIITFSTQHGPILTALAFASVFEVYSSWTIGIFKDKISQPRIQVGMAAVFKATVIHSSQPLLNELIDRCGTQGLYSHNQISELALAQRGNSIAEGDVLVLCIRECYRTFN